MSRRRAVWNDFYTSDGHLTDSGTLRSRCELTHARAEVHESQRGGYIALSSITCPTLVEIAFSR